MFSIVLRKPTKCQIVQLSLINLDPLKDQLSSHLPVLLFFKKCIALVGLWVPFNMAMLSPEFQAPSLFESPSSSHCPSTAVGAFLVVLVTSIYVSRLLNSLWNGGQPWTVCAFPWMAMFFLRPASSWHNLLSSQLVCIYAVMFLLVNTAPCVIMPYSLRSGWFLFHHSSSWSTQKVQFYISF